MAMDILFVCLAVDESHPALANQVRWIRVLAGKPDVGHVRVLTPCRGRAELPVNVTVHVFGEARSPTQLYRFYREVLRAHQAGVDLFFVAQGGPYPILLYPVKILTRRPMYQWKAHTHVPRRMRFYARFCDDLVFTATPSSFPVELENRRIVGHGIDTDLFRPLDGKKTRDLVTVGRVVPKKRLEWMVRALSDCRKRFGVTYDLDIVGSCPSTHHGYRDGLRELIAELGMEDSVRLLGSVEHADLPGLLDRYRAGINFATTAFDKAAGETMACGLPLITTNRSTVEVLPAGLRCDLAVEEHDVGAQAEAIHRVLSWDEGVRQDIGRQLRAAVVAEHGLDAFFDKILWEIAKSK